MPGFRTLIVLLAIVAALLLVRRLWPRRRTPPPAIPPAQMVRCHHCGLYLPREDAVLREGNPYCSRQHADQDSANPPS